MEEFHEKFERAWNTRNSSRRADHDRVKNQVEKQRRRADQAEKALEPLRHNIRQLNAEVEAKADELRVVSGTFPFCLEEQHECCCSGPAHMA